MNKAFFVGIKGVGMTSLALAMQDSGYEVMGSDTSESFITDEILSYRGIKIQSLDAQIPKVEKLICSAAYSSPNSTPLAEALADFIKDKRIIAVAGVGGKTTTSAMLAAMFHACGRDVGYYVGTGSIAGLSAPGHLGKDPFFVVEADEYAISKTDHRPKFSLLKPDILITTNIIHDHPDIYATEADTMKAFTDLVLSIKPGGIWICNPKDRVTAQILTLQGQALKGIKVIHYGSKLLDLKLNVFGSQNQLDASAAVLAGIEAGLSESQALTSIKAYRGAGRRQEYRGEVSGRLLYDDYGHHPKEIELTIKSFKEHFPNNRLLLVFESHTYSRTESLLPEFAKSLSLADKTFIMPIFESAREKGKSHSVTPASFAQLIRGADALTWENAASTVWEFSRSGDIILTMGAGFVYKLHNEFKSL